MSGKEISSQTLIKKEVSDLRIAYKYYSIVTLVNDIHLTPMEINLLAYIAVRGTITPPSARDEFIRIFASSKNSLANIKGKLLAKNLLVKIEGKYKINPSICPDIKNGLILKLFLKKEDGDSKVNTGQ